jgi:hypothetical protein
MTDFEDKVLNLLENINKKLDTLLSGSKSQSSDKHIGESHNTEGYVKPSAVVEKQEEEERALEKPPVEGRRVCPECGGTDFRSEEDKNQILHQMGGIKIYKRIYICKRCGFEMQ